jgi:integrase
MDKVKKSGNMRYWVSYRVNGKQRLEYSGTDFEQAKAGDGKRSCQKAEGRILDILQSSKITFRQLSDWYYTQVAITRLKSFKRLKIGIENFNAVLGDNIVSDITKDDLAIYQEKRKNDFVRSGAQRKEGNRRVSPSTVDMEISIVKTMVNYAFLEDKISGTSLKAFIRTKKQVRTGSNARTRTFNNIEFAAIMKNAKKHVCDFMIIAINTGMRLGEIRQLKWENIDNDMRFIRLDSSDTKEKKSKVIPINQNVKCVLERQLRWIHHNFVLTWGGNPIISIEGIKGGFINAANKAGILYGRDSGGIIFHDIRRTVKTLMTRAGIEKAHRDKILGHSQQGMDRHYIVVSDQDIESAMKKYSQVIDSGIW